MPAIKDTLFQIKILFLKFKSRITLLANLTLFLISLASVFLLVIYFGYNLNHSAERSIVRICTIFLFVFFIASSIRYVLNFKDVIKEKLLFIDIISYLLLFGVLSVILFFPNEMKRHVPFLTFLSDKYLVFSLLGLLSMINFSKFTYGLLSSKANPSLLFIYSFLFIILVGAGLLMLPNSTHQGIRFTDALFTATTSVCVTGLCTVDVPATFTLTGQIIILLLIQIGGIGVMTFTSFFALSFMGESSFSGKFLLKDFLNEENLGNMFKSLVNILFVTFSIEAIGAYLIWNSIHNQIQAELHEEIFISVFHSVSAFCNAGISIFEGNLTNRLIAHNYSLQFWIALLIIVGGLGFPIVFNYIKLLKHISTNYLRILFRKQNHYIHRPRIINIHTRIVLISTIILLVAGTLLIFFSEQHRAFADYNFTGKITGSFFAAVTPRTAGFNTVDMLQFAQPTLFVMLILMMIGAAPMSTGGGMKVTSVFIGIVHIFDIARGKQRMEIMGREIENRSVWRAFAVIILYVNWMLLATTILTYTEKDARILTLLFEVVSALSTVGLSLNFSPHLSEVGKYIIIITMFIGRIGVLTFLSGVLKRHVPRNFRYPATGVIIG